MSASTPLPLAKRIGYSVLLLAFVVAVLEAAAFVTGRQLVGRPFYGTRLQRQRAALVASAGRVTFDGNVPWLQGETLHPYVGYTPLPDRPGGPSGVGGLLAAAPPKRARDRVVVAFVGGSFAHIFAEQGARPLLARLSELPAFRGRRLVPVDLAVSGYKQPQQLLSVAYLLSLGGEIDLLINIDGFNDIALHPSENAAAGVFPAYPRRWHRRVEGTLHTGALRLMLARLQLEQQRAALASAFSASPWRSLNLSNLLYALLDRQLERRMAETDHRLVAADAPGASTAGTGPPLAFASEAEMLKYLAELWQRSSRLLDRLARDTGARYYHFLQPNQYVPESKPMDAIETATAYRADHPYRRLVETGYPMLQRAGLALQADGVRYVDLSGAFRRHVERVYVDSCCHVNEVGNAILADLIFEAIRKDLERDPPRPSG